jgi:hypothetical protein
MASVTSPERFGFRSVDVFFGIVRPRPDRVVVVRGDLLQNIETEEVRVFVAREGNTVVTEAVSVHGAASTTPGNSFIGDTE